MENKKPKFVWDEVRKNETVSNILKGMKSQQIHEVTDTKIIMKYDLEGKECVTVINKVSKKVKGKVDGKVVTDSDLDVFIHVAVGHTLHKVFGAAAVLTPDFYKAVKFGVIEELLKL